MHIPKEVVDVLAGLPVVGKPEQAFPLLTVDASGFPHACLLSRAELDTDVDELLIAITSRRTRENLRRDGRATLLAVEKVTAHSLKLIVVRLVEVDGRLGAALAVDQHLADSMALALDPIRYNPSADLVREEGWAQSARCLEMLRATKLASVDDVGPPV